MTYPQLPPQRSPWSSPAVIIAIVTGVLLVIGVVLAALLLLPRLDDNSSDAAASSSLTPTTGAHGDAGPASGTSGSGGAGNATSAPETQADDPQNNHSQDTGTQNGGGQSAPHATPDISGTDWQGFTSGPRCNAADDPAVMIAETNRSQIVICQVGAQTGRWYYKGLADGDSIEVGYPTRSGNTFSATNGNVTYVVGPGQLDIQKNGETIASEPTIAYWSAS
ncbi:hypothetical protein [Gordonia aichiensis]|uniref:Protein kinase n=1 Tax=Gordonia aichiensis NBRC 108223 TaxID=1220583 RepID=L7KIC2_9ACTN|nr:hypothetical protein [Gordonia aichiensis]GAC48620.1 hypothetical protein GOACH_06_01170 [Gordonia aichiensis NBRC 108223]